MSSHRQRLVGAILGEQEVCASLRALDGASGLFAVEATRQGYQVQQKGDQITIKRVDPWAKVIGLPPLYHFHGQLRHEAGGPGVKGRILMNEPAKWFILTWISVVLAALLGGLFWGAVLASDFMLSPVTALGSSLAEAGLIVGAIFALALFGALVISFIRVISRPQRRRLLVFLKNLESGA